jgi:sugar lactone lactonase YvrE
VETELVIDAKATLGEGAVWHARRQRLYWVDIDEGKVHLFDPVDHSDQVIQIGQKVGTVVPRRSGGLMLAGQHGFAALDLRTHQLRPICDPEQDLPDNRFNDGKCDPAGRFWAGTISLKRQPRTASLYCMEPDHSVRRMLRGLTNSNGIVWSLDRATMYHIDTPTLRVTAYDYRLETGEIANPRAVVTIAEGRGRPDGMTIDAEGMLWIALWGGACIGRWDPGTGRLIRTIPIPASRVTSCAFGGPDLADLYVTTARVGLGPEESAAQPHAGGLFRVRPGITGVEAAEFAG